jgi:anaerobic ribonucleoside-triphosphate reductase activating protein
MRRARSEPPHPEPRLRLHGFLPLSHANGPGRRAVLWLQGCSLGCPGCFNPATHPQHGGTLTPVSLLAARLAALAGELEGLTVSGGEPFQQAGPLLRLLQAVRAQTTLTVIVFTGFEWAEVQRIPAARQALSCIDVLIAGRYLASQRLAQGLSGSANKELRFLTDRYTQADFAAVPPAEAILLANGELILSGIDPLMAPLEGFEAAGFP